MAEGMEHARIQADLPAFAAGRIEGEERRRLEEHVAFCERCSEMLTSLREIHAAFQSRGESLLDPHPDGDEVRAFALGEKPADERIERHLQVCASCDLEARAWRSRPDAARAGASERPAGIRSLPRRVPVPAAAGLLLGIALGLAASLLWQAGATRPPEGEAARALPESATSPPPEGAAAAPKKWSGPARTIVLPRALRGDASDLEVTLGSGEEYVNLAVPDFLAAAVPDRARYGFTIREEDGAAAWASEMTASEIRRHLRSAEAVTLVVPAEVLAPGSLEFVVAMLGPDSTPPDYRVRIQVVRSP